MSTLFAWLILLSMCSMTRSRWDMELNNLSPEQVKELKDELSALSKKLPRLRPAILAKKGIPQLALKPRSLHMNGRWARRRTKGSVSNLARCAVRNPDRLAGNWAAVQTSKLSLHSQMTYMGMAGNFVRWLKDEFNPGSRKAPYQISDAKTAKGISFSGDQRK
jgi:hypothetical protein